MTVDGYKSLKRPCHIWLIYGIPFKSQCLFLPLYHFLYLFHFPYFSCRFLNPIKFSNLNSNVLDLRNLQEQVKKNILSPKFFLTFHCLNKLFWRSQKCCKFSTFSLEFQKFFSITRTFFSHSMSEKF